MQSSSINWHSVKIFVLAAIPVILAVIGAIQGSVSLPEWVSGLASVLLLIEHTANGNTGTPAQ